MLTLDVTISKSMNFRNEQYLEFFEFGSDDIQLRIFELLLTYGEEGSQQYTEQHDKVFTLIPEFLVKCSKYFTNSKLTFNEKSKEFIILLRNGEKKSLSILSSGQKQIISFFFYLYFFNLNASPFIIIDEPELSISIDWQERILSDLLESNCSGLVTATHSPFIITDSLKPYTEGLNRYIQERV